MDRKQAAIEGRLQRLYGMSPASKAQVDAFEAKTDDWWRDCKVCKKRIRGTREQVLKPCDCDGKSS